MSDLPPNPPHDEERPRPLSYRSPQREDLPRAVISSGIQVVIGFITWVAAGAAMWVLCVSMRPQPGPVMFFGLAGLIVAMLATAGWFFAANADGPASCPGCSSGSA
jgi:hypothetical protein